MEGGKVLADRFHLDEFEEIITGCLEASESRIAMKRRADALRDGLGARVFDSPGSITSPPPATNQTATPPATGSSGSTPTTGLTPPTAPDLPRCLVHSRSRIRARPFSQAILTRYLAELLR
jgi:hypothetical protein